MRCPYHSWTYALDGSLLRAPHTEDGDVEPADFALHPVGVEVWGGFVFVHLDARTRRSRSTRQRRRARRGRSRNYDLGVAGHRA